MVNGKYIRIGLVRGLGGFILLLLVTLLDPLGLDGAMDRHSVDVVSRMTAPFYGSGPPRGRSQIAVIEVSDTTLARNQIGWPPPRAVYARLLKNLIGETARPAVVFFDYSFISESTPRDRAVLLEAIQTATAYKEWGHDPSCQASALSKIRCIKKADGVPVIVGKVYPPNACLASMVRTDTSGDDIRLAHVAAVTPLGWPNLQTEFRLGFSRAQYLDDIRNALPEAVEGAPDPPDCYALMQETNIDLPAQDFAADDKAPVLVQPPRIDWAPLGFGAGFDVTPAVAMAYALCREPAVGPGAEREMCEVLRRAAAGEPAELLKPRPPATPEWGSVIDPTFYSVRKEIHGGEVLRSDEACVREKRNLPTVLRVGWAQFTSGLGEGEAAAAVPCPYHLTMDADTVLFPPSGKLADIQERFNGRAVAIGAAQALTNDWVSTTLSAQRAGVHYHAMTLDNLIEHGLNLRHPPPDTGLPWINLDCGEALELLCAFLIVGMVGAARAWTDDFDTVKTPPLPSPFGPAARERYLEWWALSQADRHRIAVVAGLLLCATLILVGGSILTILWRWDPVNIVALMGLTVIAIAAEFWDSKGWRAVAGFFPAAAVLVPPVIARWFARPVMAPPSQSPPSQSPPSKSRPRRPAGSTARKRKPK